MHLVLSKVKQNKLNKYHIDTLHCGSPVSPQDPILCGGISLLGSWTPQFLSYCHQIRPHDTYDILFS
jgi:hypothetical protein